MPIRFEEVLNDFHYQFGAWPPSMAMVQQTMSQFASTDDYLAYLKAHANDPGMTAGATAAMPDWAISAIGDQIGSAAAYLTIPELAPTIVMAAALQWSPAHLNTAIEQTDYFKTHTQASLSWQTMSPADRESLVEGTMAKLAQAFGGYYGVDKIPDIAVFRDDATKIASGQETIDYWQYVWRKTAESTPSTPAAQAVAAAARQANQPAMDQANLQAQLLKTWQSWMGDYAPLTDLGQWTMRIYNNEASQADFEARAREAAASLYPTKPPNQPYSQWVTGPKSVLTGTLELPSVDDNDLLLQSYLQGRIGNLGDLKIAAQQDPRYDGTQQAKVQARQTGFGILNALGLGWGGG